MFKSRRPAAVLFDRDGTLIQHVPHNRDPALVRPAPGARAALRRLRDAGILLGVVTSQPGVADGLVSPDQLHQVNERVEELLGPFDAWAICVHGEADDCSCRGPRPGLVIRAATVLDVSPLDCLLVGGHAAEMAAARMAGARAVLLSAHGSGPPAARGPAVTVADWTAVDLTEVAEQVMELDPMGVFSRPIAGGVLHPAHIAGWGRW